MAEIALLSNQASSLYASSKASGGSDKSAYIYDMKQSSVNKFRERFVKTPINGASFASTATCEVPAFGVLKQMVLKTVIRYNQTDATTVPMFSASLFSQLIDQCSIKNSSREIQVLYGDCIKYLVYNLPDHQSKKWRLAGLDNMLCADAGAYKEGATSTLAGYRGQIKADGNDNDVVVYTVLPFSFFEDFGSSSQYKNCLNTRFLERLSLDIKFAEQIKVVNGATSNATTFKIQSCDLLCSFDVIQDKELQEIESANYSLSQPLAMVVGNWNKTRAEFEATSASMTFPIQLFNTDLAHSLLITVKKISDATQLATLAQLVNEVEHADNTDKSASAGMSMGYGRTATGNLIAGIANNHSANVFRPHTNLHAIPRTATQLVAGAPVNVTTVPLGLGTSRPGQDLCKVDAITITSAGREIYKSETHEETLLLTNTDKRGSCWFSNDHYGRTCGEVADLTDPMGCSRSNLYVIPFGDDSHTDAIRGCLSMKNLNSVKVEVKCSGLQAPATGNARYEVCVYVRKYSALSIESNSGRVSVAVST